MSEVVITGIGIISPIGMGKDAVFEACLAGKSGAKVRASPWAQETGLSCKIVCPVEGFDPSDHRIDTKTARLMDRTTQFAVAAADAAVRDASLDVVAVDERKGKFGIEGTDPYRIATFVGTGIGGLTSLELAHATWIERKSKEGVKRYSLPMLIPNASAGHVSIRFRARGPCLTYSTACAAGTMAIGEGFRTLQRGDADIAICGGTEGVADDEDCLALMGFDRLKTLSTRNEEPQRASRPFDLDRDGFVLGEGAAFVILERREHAAKRSANIYGSIRSYATNCDAHSMLQLDEGGDAIRRVWQEALQEANVPKIDFVSAHGTSTKLNDRVEAKMANDIFADGVPPVTGVKSMTGHAIAASGAMEIALAAMSIQRGVITPTINYETPDPECNVPVVSAPREGNFSACLKPSYAFGGHNAAMVIASA